MASIFIRELKGARRKSVLCTHKHQHRHISPLLLSWVSDRLQGGQIGHFRIIELHAVVSLLNRRGPNENLDLLIRSTSLWPWTDKTFNICVRCWEITTRPSHQSTLHFTSRLFTSGISNRPLWMLPPPLPGLSYAHISGSPNGGKQVNKASPEGIVTTAWLYYILCPSPTSVLASLGKTCELPLCWMVGGD